MKKNIAYLVALIAVAAVIWFVFFKPKGNVFGESQAGFTVEDTGAINKVFITKTGGESVVLDRKRNGWIADGKYKVAKPVIDYFLTTLTKQIADEPVPEAKHNNVISVLAGNNVKVELYFDNGDEPLIFYVGDEAFGFTGTYMLKEGAKRPYIVNVPGFSGSLYSRYPSTLKDWRDRTVFGIQPENISSISVQYPSAPAHSFILKQQDGDMTIQTDTAINGELIKSRLKDYAGFFSNVICEGFMNGAYDINRVISSVPIRCMIDITGKDGYSQHATIYWQPINRHSKNLEDNDTSYYGQFDADHYYAVFNNDQDTAIVQSRDFNKLFRSGIEFFQLKD